jgi:hypothetical protein
MSDENSCSQFAPSMPTLPAFLAHNRTNGNNMQRVYDIERPGVIFNGDVESAYEYKLRVRHRKLIAVRSAHDQRAGTAELFENGFSIHAA